LGTLGGMESMAYGINNLGQVVGNAQTALGADHAFLYDGGTMIDLNDEIPPDAGWTLQYAHGINDAGQITGYGINPSGKVEAFLLTLDGPTGAAGRRAPSSLVPLDLAQGPPDTGRPSGGVTWDRGRQAERVPPPEISGEQPPPPRTATVPSAASREWYVSDRV